LAEDKFDKVMEKLADIVQRLVVVETLIKERKADTDEIYKSLHDMDDRVSALELHQTKVVSAKDVVTWLFMAVIAIWGVMK